tara:strand:+ start:3069 stop:3878 length:810 start_codon:yes stop_codon:yes gene_type:complete
MLPREEFNPERSKEFLQVILFRSKYKSVDDYVADGAPNEIDMSDLDPNNALNKMEPEKLSMLAKSMLHSLPVDYRVTKTLLQFYGLIDGVKKPYNEIDLGGSNNAQTAQQAHIFGIHSIINYSYMGHPDMKITTLKRVLNARCYRDKPLVLVGDDQIGVEGNQSRLAFEDNYRKIANFDYETDPDKFVERAKEGEYDALLIDLNWTDEDRETLDKTGFRVLDQVRNFSPIRAVHSSVDEEIRKIGYENGATHIIEKGLPPDEMEKILGE